MNHPALRDAALLLLRFIVGAIFIAHGVDKLFITGLVETMGQLSAADVPQPQVVAYLAAATELICGALMTVGAFTTFAAIPLIPLVLGAAYFVHLDNGVFAHQGGVELVALLAAALVVIVVFGPGRASVDGVIESD